MSEQPKFEPIRPAHAIERRAATVIFERPIGAEMVTAALNQARTSPDWSRLQQVPQPVGGLAITVDEQTRKISVGQPDGMFSFALPNNTSQLVVAPEDATPRPST